MARVKRGMMTRKRHNKVLEQAKGFRMSHHSQFKQAKEAVQHALQYAYRDRRNRKRDFRRLWITRINAATRLGGLSYSRFIYGLKNANVQVDRKVLADIAVRDAATFGKLVELAKANLD